MRHKVLLNKEIHPQAMDLLKQHFDVLIADNPKEEALLKKCVEVSAIITRTSSYINKKIIEASPKLKVISKTGVGVDNIDVSAATEKGILICNVPGVNSISVAEHTVALILAVVKDLLVMDKAVRKGEWSKRYSSTSVELKQKTLGIIGLGSIGRKVVTICQSFQMKILVYDPYLVSSTSDKLSIDLVSNLEELFKKSDVISIHVPYNEKTHHLVNSSLLKMIKKGAVLINTSRGQIIDEKALFEALKDGPLAAAGLDVFEEEPVNISNPLLTLENVILTPHSAALTKECSARIAVEAAQAVIDVLNGKKPRSVFNEEGLRKKGYL
jgi:D-3-phosphoglycerate dehydrogenase